MTSVMEPMGRWAKFRVVEPGRADRARTAGASTLDGLRRVLARKAAELIRNDPDEAARALEVGIVDRRWLERPGEHPISTAAPAAIVERFLERSVEQRPSRLANLSGSTPCSSWPPTAPPGATIPS
jgi:hypothetical protein